jgi:hypothetical protein
VSGRTCRFADGTGTFTEALRESGDVRDLAAGNAWGGWLAGVKVELSG